jgi:hypothetical protein
MTCNLSSGAKPSADIVSPVVAQMLESMYFCSPNYYGVAQLEGPVIGASLSFSGPASGDIRLVAQVALVTRMAADFLGLETCDVDEQQLHATIRELASVTCCAIIASWMPGCDFHFGIPRGLTDDELKRSLRHGFSFDAGVPEFGLEVKLGASA